MTNKIKQNNPMAWTDQTSFPQICFDWIKFQKIFLSNGGWFNGDQSHGIKSASKIKLGSLFASGVREGWYWPLGKNEYPPGNDHVSHLGIKKMIDSTVPNGRGYVSDIRSKDGRLFGSTVK